MHGSVLVPKYGVTTFHDCQQFHCSLKISTNSYCEESEYLKKKV